MNEKGQKTIEWGSMIYAILIVLMFFVGLGAGYMKGVLDTTTALAPTINENNKVMQLCQNKYLDCEKELWIKEKMELS